MQMRKSPTRKPRSKLLRNGLLGSEPRPRGNEKRKTSRTMMSLPSSSRKAISSLLLRTRDQAHRSCLLARHPTTLASLISGAVRRDGMMMTTRRRGKRGRNWRGGRSEERRTEGMEECGLDGMRLSRSSGRRWSLRSGAAETAVIWGVSTDHQARTYCHCYHPARLMSKCLDPAAGR